MQTLILIYKSVYCKRNKFILVFNKIEFFLNRHVLIFCVVVCKYELIIKFLRVRYERFIKRLTLLLAYKQLIKIDHYFLAIFFSVALMTKIIFKTNIFYKTNLLTLQKTIIDKIYKTILTYIDNLKILRICQLCKFFLV